MTERMQMRLKVERLAAMLTDSEKTKRDILSDDGEEVTGVRIGWGAWALLRAAIVDVIETKCGADDEARRTVSGQEAVTEGELIAISNALQGTGYAYLADKLRNAAPIPATEQKEPK